MRRGYGGRGARGGGGGLGRSFVSSSDSDSGARPYRGAEIAPPPTLGSSSRRFPPPESSSSFSSGSSSSTMISGNVPPPSNYANNALGSSYAEREKSFQNPTPGVSKHGYSSLTAISNKNMTYAQYGVPVVKKQRTEEEYFNDDEGEDKPSGSGEGDSLPYQPAPGSPGRDSKKDDSDSEEDPLDAFMANLESEAKTKGLKSGTSASSSKGTPGKVGGETSATSKASLKGVRDDIEEEDEEEQYYKWMEENPNAGRNLDDDGVEIEYDADGNPIAPTKDRFIDPLPALDHSEIRYKPFEKNFYNEHVDIAGLSNIQVIDLQFKLGIRTAGAIPPKPVTSFAHFGFDDTLLKAIRKSEFTQPTPIQAQGIPAVLSGRDVIGIAKTGSGKTAAFLWPMLVHIMDQPRLVRGDGPIGLVLAPTRELAMQIYSEAKKFGKIYEIQVVCAYGGGSKWEQSKTFEAGAEIAIATPGRMIDMIKMKVTNLERVTYLVLDEADRMFDMGFEPQVRSICNHVRPDRQCSLFSATFKKRIERLARDALMDPVKIVQGNVGEASEDVQQFVRVLGLGGFKWSWLLSHIVEFTSAGSVLIFVTKKQNCEELAHNLTLKEIECRCIHGDLNQHERNEIIHKFKKQEFNILVATDVAARGLDIPHIRTVVNFDIARDIDTHTHRIGRTGRAGVKGKAYTLVNEKDKEFAGHIVRNLEAANQDVSKELMELALKSSWFKNSRFKRGRGKGCARERPGLGSGSSTPSGSKPLTGANAIDPSSEQYIYGDSSAPSVSTSSGGGRLSAVKQAFKNQYMSKFKKSTTEDPRMTGGITMSMHDQQQQQQDNFPPPVPSPSNSTMPPPGEQSARKRKSRWE